MQSVKKAEMFLQSYHTYLDEASKNETIAITKSQLAFDAKKYEVALSIIRSSSFSNFQFTMNARWILLCSHFILNRENKPYMQNIIRNYFNFFNHNKEKISHSNYSGSINLGRVINLLVKNPNKETTKLIYFILQ